MPERSLAAALKRGEGAPRRRLAGARASFHRVRRRGRVRQVESAALLAAERDERLAPEAVRTCAESLFRLAYLAWEECDLERLARLLSPKLMRDWEGRLDDAGLAMTTEVLGDVEVDYVNLVQAVEETDIRAVVLIDATLRHVPARGRRLSDASEEIRRLDQYWTLGLRDGLWTVLSIEERGAGDHHLAEPIEVAVPVG